MELLWNVKQRLSSKYHYDIRKTAASLWSSRLDSAILLEDFKEWKII